MIWSPSIATIATVQKQAAASAAPAPTRKTAPIVATVTPSGRPAWLIPAVVGVIAIGGFFLYKKFRRKQ